MKSKPSSSGQEGRQANEIRRHGLSVLQENQKGKTFVVSRFKVGLRFLVFASDE